VGCLEKGKKMVEETSAFLLIKVLLIKLSVTLFNLRLFAPFFSTIKTGTRSMELLMSGNEKSG
jgi:hypothetical protein